MSKFEIIDRRRMGKEQPAVEEAPKQQAAPQKGFDEWRNVCYVLAFMPDQSGGIVPFGRAVGVRKDGMGPFVADYLLAMQWGPEFKWQPYAKKRLDTFLGCACKPGDRCKYHTMALQHWQQEDVQRVGAEQSLPMPEAMELLHKAEQAARTKQPSNLIIPR